MPTFAITNVGTAALYDPNTGVAVAGFNKLDQITIAIDSKMTEVYGGTSAYPMINILADRKPAVTLKGPEMNLGAYYRLLGATNTAASSGALQQQPVVGDTYTIPTGAPYTLTLSPAISATSTTLTIFGDLDGTVFTVGTPAAGQYSIAGSVLTFNVADAGKVVRVYYDTDTAVGSTIGVSASAIPGIYTLKATARYLQNISDPAKTAYNISFVAYSVQLIGSLSVDMQRQAATSQSIQLDILDPGNGKNPVEIRTNAKY